MTTTQQRTITDAERCAIMERIAERCSTSLSPKAHATGRLEPFVTVCAYPFLEGCPRAEFAWETADRISKNGGRFNLR